MSKISINAHHGSPGTPNDFELLKVACPNIEWSTSDRFNNQTLESDCILQLGHSWGSYHAIKTALANPKSTKAVILIAPYLFVDKKMSGVIKTILSTPVIGKLLLSRIAPRAIEKLLADSSSPSKVPAAYRKNKDLLTAVNVLRPALFEKNIQTSQIIADLEALDKLSINVFVIRGDLDKTSSNGEQFKLLSKHLKFHEVILKDAGHALPWTHPIEIAKELQKLLPLLTGANNETKSAFPIDLKGSKISEHKPFGYHNKKSALNNVASFLSQHAATIGERPILSWVHPDKVKAWSLNLDDPLEHDSVSVKELEHLVAVVAAGLSKLGIKKKDRVIVFVPMSLYLYVSMFALQKIGAIATFLDGWARRDQMDVAAKVVEAKAFISVEQAFDYMGDLPEISKVPLKISIGPTKKEYDASIEGLMKSLERHETVAVEKEDTALITFTTGSSGTPKGADRTHRFLAAQHYALDKHLPYQEDDKDLPVFPIFSLNNLAAGVTTIIPAIDVGQTGEHDALILIAQMKSAGVTCTTLSPSLLRQVYKYCLDNKITIPFIRRIITGGAPISRDDLIKTKEVAPNAEVLVLYGSTEVEPMAHIEAKEMIERKSNPDPEWEDEGVNVGKFDCGLRVKYLKIDKNPISINSDEEWCEKEVGSGKPGEIIVSGEHVCENYFNNEAAFITSKIKDHNGVVWHRTGDIGRLDENGDLWFMGRIHNAINRDGEYFFPVRAEVILKKLSFVEYAAYLGMPDEKLGEATYAVYSVKESAEGNTAEWEKEIKRVMDKNGVVIDKIVLVDKIPLDARHQSKVEYQVLRDQLLGDT